jgi:hypothetical protein
MSKLSSQAVSPNSKNKESRVSLPSLLQEHSSFAGLGGSIVQLNRRFGEMNSRSKSVQQERLRCIAVVNRIYDPAAYGLGCARGAMIALGIEAAAAIAAFRLYGVFSHLI